MNQDRLRLDLADLAEEVTPVDLRDRALRTSRRLGIQRAVATSAAALLVLAAATGTALAIRPEGRAPEPAGPSITSTAPPVERTPNPTAEPPSKDPSAGAGQPQSALTGTRYYLEQTSGRSRIHAVRGTQDRVVHEVVREDGGCAANTVTVSPDGKRVAWVRDGTDDTVSGILSITTVGDSGGTTLAEGISCLGSRSLRWQGDDLLMAQRKNGRSVLYDTAARKEVGGDPGEETNRCWSADGTWLAAVSEGKPYVTDGTDSRQYTYTPPEREAVKWDGWEARSVSPDGRFVAVGWIGTDPSRRDDSFAVVDTTSSKTVDLPGTGEVHGVLFDADGTVLVRRGTGITVLDRDLRPLGTVDEPASIRNRALLAYVP
ncbi:PD40 domain-containing protein [Micromonospora sp. NBS 11-29]|uniref:PD40 domain-containing protein n=1 Tax=Micromonospora sp. NBS 11-29 TaxID=1960879 RepID=UPI000B78979B|nr:PD40 domain-containing protein [Micromonospora sp. NBS 11-29]